MDRGGRRVGLLRYFPRAEVWVVAGTARGWTAGDLVACLRIGVEGGL
jgi:hypothetical protein